MSRQLCAAVVLSCLLLSGCATNAPLRSIPAGSRIQVLVSVPEVESPEALDTAEALGVGALGGAGAGLGAGAVAGLEASVVCGPMIIYCAPILMMMGGAAGAVVGGVGGSVMAATVALPHDKAAELERLIEDYVAAEDIPANLLRDFDKRQNGRWTVVDSHADTVVTLGIEDLRFVQFGRDELLVRLTSNVVVRYGPQDADVTKRILVVATSARHHVDHWIADDGANLRAGLDAAFAENSRQLVGALSQIGGAPRR